MKRLVEAELVARGWEKMDPPEDWGLLVEDACSGLLRVPGEEGPVADAARLHLARRSPGAPPKNLEFSGLLVEWTHTLTPYATAWRPCGSKEMTRSR
eukprot:13917071-Heterocapsa_arctica.AAC.1